MGNFEKLSVLVIGVIIVMILVVALYTWTDDPSAEDGTDPGIHRANHVLPVDHDRVDDRLLDEPRGTGTGLDWPGPDFVDPKREVDPIDPKLAVVIGDEEVGDDSITGNDRIADDEDEEIIGGDPAVERTVIVKEGESLGVIAQRELGSVRHTAALAARNDIKDPARIRIGMELIIPVIADGTHTVNKPSGGVVASGPAKPGAAYKVRSGDTIQKISQAAYGTIERWTDIWFANIERVEDPRFLREGMDLSLPN